MIYPGQGLPPPANSSATMLLADLGGMSTAQGAGYPQPGPGHLALDKTVSAAPHNPLITLATAICAIHWWRWLGPASHQFLRVCSGSQTACSGRCAVCSDTPAVCNVTLLQVCSVTFLAGHLTAVVGGESVLDSEAGTCVMVTDWSSQGLALTPDMAKVLTSLQASGHSSCT